MRRRGTEDDEGSSAKRPASSPLKTRSQRRRLEEEAQIQTRARIRSRAQGAPTMYELAAPTRRKRTVASTSGDLLEELGSIPITADYVQPGSSIDHRGTISRAALNWERPTPASSSSVLSLLPPAGSMRADLGATPPIAKPWISPLHAPDYGDAPNWNDRAPLSRRYSTGHESAPRYDAPWTADNPNLLEGSRPLPFKNRLFMAQTKEGRPIVVPLARIHAGDVDVDADCYACTNPLTSAERLACPPCGHLTHDSCLRRYHENQIKAMEKENRKSPFYDPDFNARAVYDYPCPICRKRVKKFLDVKSATKFETFNYPFDMRYQRR